MTSALQRITAAVPSYRQIGDELNAGNIALNDADFTDGEYNVEADQYAKIIAVSNLVTTDKTIKLPTGSATMDGFYIRVLNDTFYNITIKPDSAVAVWNSGKGYGIDLPNKGTLVKLMYLHSLSKWIITEKTGGKVLIEGLKLHEPMSDLGSYQIGSTPELLGQTDRTSRHRSVLQGSLYSTFEGSNANFLPSCWIFDQSGFAAYQNSSDWNIFGTQTGYKTVSLWIYRSIQGQDEYILAQSEANFDINNRWLSYLSPGGYIYLMKHSEGSNDVALAVVGFPVEVWVHVAFIISGSEIGIYLNGIQRAFENSWSVDTFGGNLFVGQHGNSAGYFTGRMQDLHLSYNNPYNANPQPDNSDSFIVPASPFEGVML